MVRIEPAACRPSAGANEFAAGKSQSPPSRTRRHGCVRRPTHLRVRNRGIDRSCKHSSDFLRERTTCNQKSHKHLRATEGPRLGYGGASRSAPDRPLGSAGEILQSRARFSVREKAVRRSLRKSY
jgi:hypothetical protein